MNRKTAGFAATLVALAGATSALGQLDVTASNTVVGTAFHVAGGNYVGPLSVTEITVPDGTLTDADAITLTYEVVLTDGNGNEVVLVASTPIPAAAIDGDGGAAPSGDPGDDGPNITDQGANYDLDIFWNLVPGFAAQLTNAADIVANASNETDPTLRRVAAFVRVTATDAQGVPNTLETNAVIGGTGLIAAGEALRVDNRPLQIVNVSYDRNVVADTTDDVLYITFNRPLMFDNTLIRNGDNPAAPNGTRDDAGAAGRPGLDDLVPADFNVSINGATPVAVDATFDAAPGSFIGDTRTVEIQLTAGSNLIPDASTQVVLTVASGGHLVDVFRNDAQNLSAPITLVEDGLNITGVEALASVIDENGAAVANALRVTYNMPLDPADLGDANFYNNNVANNGLVNVDNNVTAPTDLRVTGVTIDPSNGAAVLLSLADANDAGVDPNEVFQLYDDARSFSVDTSTGQGSILQLLPGGGNAPQGLGFASGNAAYAGATGAVFTLTDSIAPTFDSFGFTDDSGNGDVDTALFIFREPISTTNVLADLNIRQNDALVNPFDQIGAGGGLAQDNVAFSTTNITIAGVSVDPVNGFNPSFTGLNVTNFPPRLLSNGTASNAWRISFDPTAVDWDGDGTTQAGGDTTEAIPGTGGAVSAVDDFLIGNWAALTLNFTDGTNTTTLAQSAAFPAAAGVTSTSAFLVDRANPIAAVGNFFTGDNQLAGSNVQYWREIAGGGALASVPGATALDNNAVGDQTANNRAATFWSEPLAGAPGAGVANAIVDGIAGVFQSAAPAFITNNGFTFAFNGTAGERDDILAVGSLITIPTNVGIVDNAANPGTTVDLTINDAVAPYVPLFANADNTAGAGLPTVGWQAFLEDLDGDSFADQVRLNFTQNIQQARLDTVDGGNGFTDFSVAGVTVSSTDTASGVDDNEVVVGFNDGVISVAGNVAVTYNSSTTSTIVGVNGFSPADQVTPAADAAAALLAAQPIDPLVDGFTPAIMTLQGNLTGFDGNPVPVGTKVFATVAIPTVVELDFTWNNLDLEYDLWDTEQAAAIGSMAAFTDALLGIESELYLNRNNGNVLTFTNEFDAAVSVAGGTGDFETNEDTIEVNINSRNLSRVTFSGNGQTGEKRVLNRLRNGSATLAWDVMRSTDGSYALFASGDVAAGGYVAAGIPILSRDVTTTNDGAFTINVTGPTNAFNNGNVLASIDFPVILVAELPNGQRFALSSLLSSANSTNNFAPINFDPEVETRDQAGSGDNVADGSSTFNFDLRNVASNQLFTGWNLLSYGQDNGWAASNSNIPGVLTAGLTDADANGTPDNIFVSNALPAAGALEQFTYWADVNPASTTPDGIWTNADDAAINNELGSIILDLGRFDVFAFTMTDRGVQFGDGMNNFVGGYAAGVFVTANAGAAVPTASNHFGVFQFGPDLNDANVVGNSIINNSTTLGWALVTVTNPDGNADTAADDATAFFGVNSNLDYFIILDNQGPTATASERIDITSAASAGSALTSPNDLLPMTDNVAGFSHVAAP